MQITAIKIRPLIMVNVSSSTLNILHLIEAEPVTNGVVVGLGLNSCGLDATIPFSTVAKRWQRLA